MNTTAVSLVHEAYCADRSVLVCRPTRRSVAYGMHIQAR